MYFADVPKSVIRLGVGQVPEHPAVADETASRRRAAASPPTARPDTSQFHIIQPQVVK